MKCPVDETELLMTDRQGIEIDYCPKCRGVWLDRGELDKIIERAAPESPEPATDPRSGPPPATGPRSGPPLSGPRDDYRGGARYPGDRDHERDYPPRDRDYGRDHYRDDYDDRSRGRRKRKRKSLLEELFDFDFD